MAKQTALLAAGCFWCIEASFSRLIGVQKVTSGYTGGNAADANYKAVCSGLTDHAEVVEIEFDDQQITYQQLLDVFFFLHDPTQLNKQGNDIGRQYRSAIFYTNLEQKIIAENLIKKLDEQAIFAKPIVTELVEADTFYPAEAYHQGYFDENPNQGYCMFIIAPKYAKFIEKYKNLLKA